VTVTANVVQGDIGQAMRKVQELPAAREADDLGGRVGPMQKALIALHLAKAPAALSRGEIPAGVKLVSAGDTEQLVRFFGQFAQAMLWGILLVYGVLVLLFRDFFQPITILTAFPLSIGGALLGLAVTHQPFSLFVGIGFVMLMGIVTKNSILLVDFAIEMMHKGMSREEALLEAGKKRARPIVMTTIAMSAGMIPAAAGWGVDGSLRQGMGASVIGGLLLSTLLSLIFVPAVFVLISKLEAAVTPIFARFSTRGRYLGAETTPAE